jgi:CheY-like chemotaxis protein
MNSESATQLKVLVAEDEPAMLSLVARHMRNLGFSVVEAGEGDVAWALAQQHHPDLVVLDVMMPGMSGWELCKRLKGEATGGGPFARTGVIMLTGIGENLNEMTSPLFAADAWLNKPFDFGELDAKVRETLSRYSKEAPTPVSTPQDEESENGEAEERASDAEEGAPAASSEAKGKKGVASLVGEAMATIGSAAKRLVTKVAQTASAVADVGSSDAGAKGAGAKKSGSASSGGKTTAKRAAAEKPAAKPAGKSAAKPAAKSGAKPAAKSAAKPAAKSAAKPAAKSGAKPAAKSGAKPAAKSAAKPAAKSSAKPAAKSAAKPGAKPAAKPAAKSGAKPAAKSAAKPAAKSAAKPASKPAAKPAKSRAGR